MSVYAYGMDTAALVRRIRAEAGLSLRAMAAAAGTAVSTVHRIERGELRPTVDTLARLAEAAGMALRIETDVDYASSLVGLSRSIVAALGEQDESRPVRMAAELVHRFHGLDRRSQSRMIGAEPPPTGDVRWDAFVGGLGEWLAVRGRVPAPGWTYAADRFLERGWWITSMASMRAWEYAGAPAAFKIRGVYVHRDSLTNV